MKISPLPEDIEERAAQDFIERLPRFTGEIETQWLQFFESRDLKKLRFFQLLIHHLAETSATLGYRFIASPAKTLEAVIQGAIKESGLQDAQIQNMVALYEILKTTLDKSIQNRLKLTGAKGEPADELKGSRSAYLVTIVEEDLTQAQELANQVRYFGYEVQMVNTLAGLKDTMIFHIPTILIINMVFTEGEQSGAEAIMEIKKEYDNFPPVIFISKNTDFSSRLQAVRAGGEAFISVPVDYGLLIDILDNLVVHETPEPYRVLIIDDSALAARFSEAPLKNKGILTRIVTSPYEVIDVMYEFNPNLILLDVNMPDCTGLEMAKIIRQIDKFLGIPIVFLSAETDRDRQLEAMSTGGDDFLAKPIHPRQLISAVSSRIQRYRDLNTLMLHDSLTGLYKHTTIKEKLEQEISRSERLNTQLAIAMIDLDHFKMVNDQYGHPVGDRVLKNLARFLSQRLRKTDMIGRYGGEEFAVIMPDTSAQAAQNVLEQLRSGFERIRHLGGKIEFSVTFSCGIATHRSGLTMSQLIERADQALYSAKQAGRNTVFLIE